MSGVTDTLASLGVNVSAPAVTNFSSNQDFQLWAPSVAKAANSNGIDPTVALALVGHESSWNPNALSEKSGAYGFTQTLPSTASDPGYGLSSWSPYLPGSNIDGGMSYFGKLLQNNGGDYTKALTAYNGNSDPNYVNSINSLAAAPSQEPSINDQVNGGFDTTNVPKGGITHSPTVSGFFQNFNDWIKTGAVTITVVIIALLLIVFGTMSILQPAAGKALKYLPAGG